MGWLCIKPMIIKKGAEKLKDIVGASYQSFCRPSYLTQRQLNKGYTKSRICT